MISKITSKFQTTIPKGIRNYLKLDASDALEWEIEQNRVIIRSVEKDFLYYKNYIHVADGNTRMDIEKAREKMAEKYK